MEERWLWIGCNESSAMLVALENSAIARGANVTITMPSMVVSPNHLKLRIVGAKA